MLNFSIIKSANSLIANGGNILTVYCNRSSGEVVLEDLNGSIHFGCAGGATIVLSGDPIASIVDTWIENAVIQKDEVRITFGNGKSIILEDETGGEGIEIYKK